MPGFDKTGPEGKGARTGRQLGRCNPENESEVKDSPRGLGRGFRFRFRNQSDSPGNRRGNKLKRKW